jgi:sucrose phosphorylase
MDVLVEVHGHYLEQIDVARQVDWVYDFALPPLVLQTVFTRDATHLKRWLGIRPRNAVTVLDTHDGIGVVDVDEDDRRRPGLLPAADIRTLVETIHQRSRGESRQASGRSAGNVDERQINCTFYDALGRRDNEYLVARAIQCFVPGIPQVYYVGLLAGGNDMDLLRRTGVGRDINRRYYTSAGLQQHLDQPVVRAQLALLRIRNTHGAFGGACELAHSESDRLVLEWRHGADWARLEVDLRRMRASITGSASGGGAPLAPLWQSTPESAS